jgi:hypothetical protein
LRGASATEHARLVAETEAERTRLVAEALEAAQEESDRLLASTREEARTTTSEARAAAREVLEDGSELSGDLRDLSTSLRANAERLLRDIKLAHAAMTARLDQVSPGAAIESDPRPRRASGGDLDVPEFIPGR